MCHIHELYCHVWMRLDQKTVVLISSFFGMETVSSTHPQEPWSQRISVDLRRVRVTRDIPVAKSLPSVALALPTGVVLETPLICTYPPGIKPWVWNYSVVDGEPTPKSEWLYHEIMRFSDAPMSVTHFFAAHTHVAYSGVVTYSQFA